MCLLSTAINLTNESSGMSDDLKGAIIINAKRKLCCKWKCCFLRQI